MTEWDQIKVYMENTISCHGNENGRGTKRDTYADFELSLRLTGNNSIHKVEFQQCIPGNDTV